ncbi:MAG: nucleoside monophosphate kinase [Candidatus Colwellbacteria bacterium]
MSKAILVMGPPGSGKGTQANFITHMIGARQYDTGSRLRGLVAAGELDPEQIDDGVLVTPDLVREIVKKDLQQFIDKNESIILSGSPRSITEAFGNEKQEGLIPFLERAYGKDNVLVFVLDITVEEAIDRNAKRTDGRSDDTPEVIRKRFEEQYGEKVTETLGAMKDRGYKIIDIDGMPSADRVSQKIKEHLDELR